MCVTDVTGHDITDSQCHCEERRCCKEFASNYATGIGQQREREESGCCDEWHGNTSLEWDVLHIIPKQKCPFACDGRIERAEPAWPLGFWQKRGNSNPLSLYKTLIYTQNGLEFPVFV